MATFEVTNKDDSGEGSLRAAVEAANAAPGADEIVFSGDALVTAQSPAPILLVAGPIEITDSVTIRGPGRESVVIDGDEGSAILVTAPPGEDPIEFAIEGVTLQRGLSEQMGGCVLAQNTAVTLRSVTIQDCLSDGPGGGIAVMGGPLTIEDSLITGSSAQMGGGALATGDIVVRRSALNDNTAENMGGGLVQYGIHGSLTVIEESTLSGNTANMGAGVVQYAYPGALLKISQSTLSGNTAVQAGSAVFVVYGDDLLLENSTISGNTAGSVGAVIVGDVQGTARVRNSTIVNNQAQETGAGLLVAAGDVLVESSIIANNTLANEEPGDFAIDTEGTVTVLASLVKAPGGGVDAEALSEAGNLVDVDPQLGPLADSGGPTRTHMPLDGSPVIDAGSNSAELEFDQRGDGFAREQGEGVDIGAVEVAPVEVALSLDGSPVDEGGSATVTATISRTSNLDVTIELGFSGTATKGDDYTPSAETITIAAGQTTGSITLAVVDDEEEEGEETIVVAISGVTNAVEVNPQQVTATITASDQPVPSPSPSPSPSPGGGSGGGDGCGCSSGGDAVTALALGAVMLWGVVSRRLARG